MVINKLASAIAPGADTHLLECVSQLQRDQLMKRNAA